MSQRQESAGKDDAFATDIDRLLEDRPESAMQKTTPEIDEA